jgi:hypothetical protein
VSAVTNALRVSAITGIALVVLGYLLTPGFLDLEPHASSSALGTISTLIWLAGTIVLIATGIAWVAERRNSR